MGRNNLLAVDLSVRFSGEDGAFTSCTTLSKEKIQPHYKDNYFEMLLHAALKYQKWKKRTDCELLTGDGM